MPWFILWAAGALLLLFRQGVAIAFKLLVLTLSAFYALWYYPDLEASYRYYSGLAFAVAFADALKFWPGVFALLLWVCWPLVLWSALRRPAGEATASLRRLVVLTFLFWTGWLLLYFYQPDGLKLGQWLSEWLRLPDPPTVPR